MALSSERSDCRIQFDAEKSLLLTCNGVLTITMPKAEEKKKNRFQVKVETERKLSKQPLNN